MSDEPIQPDDWKKDDPLWLAYLATLEDCTEYDEDRKRFALHSMLANLMSIADDQQVDLADLIIEGVDLYEQRGSPNTLHADGPRAFLARCSKSSFR